MLSGIQDAMRKKIERTTCSAGVSLLFPGEVITEEGDPELIRGGLYPEEEVCVEKAAAKRRREFTAGRICARRALARLGIQAFPLLNDKDGYPLWPDGIVGSISHSNRLCAAVFARKERFKGIGLDIERVREVSPRCVNYICSPPERERWGRTFFTKQPEMAALVFSAKECFYKCQYPVSRQWLGFKAVEIFIERDTRTFEVSILQDIGEIFEKGERFRGKYAFHRGYVFTGMVMENLGG